MMDAPDFSPDQHAAISQIDEWYNYSDRQTFSLGGYAGCGKSFLIAYFCTQFRRPRVVAPTGKAAYVQRLLGVDATTLHSLIYSAQTVDGKTVFTKRGSIDGDIVIVDEASMVGTKENNDLLSFNKKVLYVGDHGQLEPIGDNPNVLVNPDCRLEKIHRQAADNPILRLATAFREGREGQVWRAMRDGVYQDPSKRVTVMGKRDLLTHVGPDTQVICGYNSTRHNLNQTIRKMRGHTHKWPMAGEPLICLSNQNKYDMFNGQVATCLGINAIGRTHIDMWIGINEGDMTQVSCLKEQFGKNTLVHHKDKSVLLLDWAYALTAHKVQGSAFDDVVVYEEIGGSWDPKRWRYTVATRARERIVYGR